MIEDDAIVAGDLAHLQRGLERHKRKRPRQAWGDGGAEVEGPGVGGRARSATNPD